MMRMIDSNMFNDLSKLKNEHFVALGSITLMIIVMIK